MGTEDTTPWTSPLAMGRRGTEALTAAVDRTAALPDALETLGDVDVGTTPSDVVYEENKLELLHYDAEAAGVDAEDADAAPILVVYALINRPYILDLQADRSVVRRLLEGGHDVYLVKWNEPSRLDQHLTLEDYVDRYVDNCVETVRERSDHESVSLLGYCMGGTMSAIYAALHPEKVAALGLMAAGLCFEDTGGILEEWGSAEYYDPRALRETFGNVPADFLAAGFALMDPVENYVSKYVRFAENLEDEAFVENFARMERWLSEGVDVAGETYVEFLEKIYQENQLYRGELEVGDRAVDPANVDMPVLQLVAEYDHLVPPEASTPFNEVVGGDVETIEYATGHVGLSVSSASHEEVWPRVSEWFTDRTGPLDVETVDGIGPTFASRLRAAGIETVADLETRSAGELAAAAETTESRTSAWLEQV